LFAAAFCQRAKARKNGSFLVGVQPCQESQWRRRPSGSIQGGLKRTGHVLRDALDETSQEEGATRLDGTRGVNIHGILLPVIKNEKCVVVDDEVSPVHDPGHFSTEDRLDGERTGIVFDVMLASGSVEDEVVHTHSRTFGEEIGSRFARRRHGVSDHTGCGPWRMR